MARAAAIAPSSRTRYRTFEFHMMHSCQLRVDDLRIRLDKSLAEFQRAAVQRDKARSLYIVRQNSVEAILEINRSGERARLDRLLATSPLNVVCCGAGMVAVPSSPADSTDSGVAVSPLSSPFSGGKNSPSYHYSGVFYDRSSVSPDR
ncbi:hypothetical protein ANCCAN_11577 [Ancylostoma caninum]|uniref:Uncharacterized protein n=1 Tax=Ancylostoma caninum TaxID=29170 RepID=A0A368GFI9_ANCCA|nr:hypothetical protein ANCCAN_11577 [Ancylostoma caninum]